MLKRMKVFCLHQSEISTQNILGFCIEWHYGKCRKSPRVGCRWFIHGLSCVCAGCWEQRGWWEDQEEEHHMLWNTPHIIRAHTCDLQPRGAWWEGCSGAVSTRLMTFYSLCWSEQMQRFSWALKKSSARDHKTQSGTYLSCKISSHYLLLIREVAGTLTLYPLFEAVAGSLEQIPVISLG